MCLLFSYDPPINIYPIVYLFSDIIITMICTLHPAQYQNLMDLCMILPINLVQCVNNFMKSYAHRRMDLASCDCYSNSSATA